MHHADVLGPRPHFLRASLLTSFAVAALPGVFFLVAYVDFVSPQWDSANDSGVVQGYFFLGVSSLLAVMFALVAFPATAFFLGRNFSKGRFVGALLVLLSVISGGVGLATASALGDYKMGYVFAALFLAVASILAVPFAWLWIKLAVSDA
jgi:hypothetical protein